MHWWSSEEIEFLRKHYVSHSKKKLLNMFNDHFNLAISIGQLKAALSRYKILSGRTGCFEKGQVPANKGTKGLYNVGGNSTSFKKGQRSKNYKPVGTERVIR